MLNEEFEKRIRQSLEEAELEPSSMNWDAIEHRLPKDESNKKAIWWKSTKGKSILFLLAGITLLASIIYLASNSNQTNQIQPVQTAPPVIVPPAPPVSTLLTEAVEPEPTQTSIAASSLQNISAPHRLQTVTPSIAQNITNNIIESNPPFEEYIASLNNKQPSFDRYNPSINILRLNFLPQVYTPAPEDDEPHRKPNDTIYKFIIGANAYLMGTYRNLRATSAANAIEKSQVALRNQIEYTNTDFNGGLFIKYKIKNDWYIGTGINIYNCSERIDFASHSNTPDKPAPAIVINDQFLKSNLNNSNIFKMQGDSIYQGLAGLDQMNTIVNHYYFNEIPLNIAYHKYLPKWNWFGEAGFSLNKLTVINASVVEMDQVGFTGIVDHTNYQGISNYMVNANIAGGLGININRTFSIDLSVQFKYAVNPLINFGYAKQNPYAIGAGLVFAKKF